MKTGKSLMAGVLAMMVTGSGALFAADDMMKGDDQWKDFRMMMTQRSEMMRDMMAMQKETMMIIRNLNHKPSGEEKQRLDEMMGKLDDMIKQDREVSKKMMHKWNPDDKHHGGDW